MGMPLIVHDTLDARCAGRAEGDGDIGQSQLL